MASRRRSDAEVAIVLGAGASVPPLVSQQDLVENLLGAPDHPRIRPAKIYLRRTFKGLLEHGAPKGILRFEEIVGPLEIAEAEEYWFHFGGRKGNEQDHVLTNRQVLDSLDTWVAISLDPPNLPKSPEKEVEGHGGESSSFEEFYRPRDDSPLCYARLVSFLDQQQLLPKTVFISMNYDILLDRVLNVSHRFFPDYDLDDFVKMKAQSEPRLIKIPVKHLKLHGSLNWRMCESCHLLRDTENAVVWPQSQCNDCGYKVARPMLIRPTLLKDFRHRVWRDVWRKAGHVLASASHWIFIGYSLPMADVWMLRLLAQSARSGGGDPRRRKITVVNPDPAVGQRFKLLFPTAVPRSQNFQLWVQECVAAGKLMGK
jgi:hypothetical protein